MRWASNKDIYPEDIAHFIEAACTVLQVIEPVDFEMIENGKDLKREITQKSLDIICKGLTDILNIE